ncbi:hypothetical protein BDN70DRAFT_967945 [Pholiota conissans]|uniref:Uncharacterized protein n=1 Tax=Pholiota conissans TaxID=109636 RepID=A0A9P6CMZ0_9AGAR|nr:hypothetical protein BDN70DRAFT_967945 [Pholiota conissans]
MYFKALLSFVVAVFAAASVHAKVCGDNEKNVFESKPLTLPSGEVITMERFTCSNSSERRSPAPVAAVEKRHSFEVNMTPRASSECTASNCQCGIPCVFKGCRPVTQTIQAVHCQLLASQLQNTPGTFTIPANEGVGFILQSCEYTVFVNSATLSAQYCFDDLGVAAAELFAVCGTQQADCEGSNGGFFVDQISL